MNSEEKEKFDELVNNLRKKMSDEEFFKLINDLLNLSDEKFQELADICKRIEEETTLH